MTRRADSCIQIKSLFRAVNICDPDNPAEQTQLIIDKLTAYGITTTAIVLLSTINAETESYRSLIKSENYFNLSNTPFRLTMFL
jgi:hypothetical protein